MATEGFIYVISSVHGCKIGRTSMVKQRLTTFKFQLPFDFQLVCLIYDKNIGEAESKIHRRYKDKRIRGEWFRLNDEDIGDLFHVASQKSADMPIHLRRQAKALGVVLN